MMQRKAIRRIGMINGIVVIVFLIVFAGGIFPNLSTAATDIVHDGATAPSAEIDRLRRKSRSWIGLTRAGDIVEIFLFADDEDMEFLRGPYCGGDEGAKEYKGNYHLISAKNNVLVSRVNLGKDYHFIDGQLHDGLRKFVVPNTSEELVAIYQYHGCNNNEVEFYRVDEGGLIYKVKFVDKDDSEASAKLASHTPRIATSTNQVIFCSYDNVVGYLFCDSYVYKGKDFVQDASWMTQELYRSPRTIEGEARRALFDFLIALYHGNYSIAAYYYGGSHDASKQPNPDANVNEKTKLLGQHCTLNRGKCLIPERISRKAPEQSGEIKFVVSFITGDFAGVKVDGKSEFEFRVKRIGDDFKVLDLPPLVP